MNIMTKNSQDRRNHMQNEAVEAFISGNKKDIINVCPRGGKVCITLNILKKEGAENVLVAYPRHDIKDGWEEEIERLGMDHLNIEYTTFHSAKKYMDREYDYLVVDEIHETSDNQLDVLDGLVEKTNTIGLTGTLTQKCLSNIERRIGLGVCYEYSIQQAIEDGVLCDYEIFVHTVELDDRKIIHTTKKGRNYTEKGLYRMYSNLAKKNPIFVNKLGNIIQNSQSKLLKTKELLEGDDRIIVFCGTMDVADALGIPSYHSGNRNEELFKSFCKGEIPKIATIKMAKAGIKIVPIQRALFNYMSGQPMTAAQSICRVLAPEIWMEDKKARVDIIMSNTEYEKIRIMNTALKFFDNDKITYL